jgi:hypothetical protein
MIVGIFAGIFFGKAPYQTRRAQYIHGVIWVVFLSQFYMRQAHYTVETVGINSICRILPTR